jgi:hypothetical protein
MPFVVKSNVLFISFLVIYAICSCIGLVTKCHFWSSDGCQKNKCKHLQHSQEKIKLTLHYKNDVQKKFLMHKTYCKNP